MRIAYFGGTFDPPHRAHLRVAQVAADAFALDRVLLAPTGVQPLKPSQPYASFADRLAMTRLLCADDPRLQETDLDAPHADHTPNYTLDALQQLQRDQPGAQLFVIVGADAFQTLPQWRQPQQLLALAQWIVVSRPGFAVPDISLTTEQRDRVHVLNTLDEDASASAVRQRLRLGIACDTWLTPTVALYIARMHLYHAS